MEEKSKSEVTFRANLGELEKAIRQATGLGEEGKPLVALLVVWNGSDSSRFSFFMLNRESGWLAQYDAVVVFTESVIRTFDPEKPTCPLTDQATKLILPTLGLQESLQLPMLLFVWHSPDSVLFNHFFISFSDGWQFQLAGFCHYFRDMLMHARMRGWDQSAYEVAKAAQERERFKFTRPQKGGGLITP
jgi:hypothetical protein